MTKQQRKQFYSLRSFLSFMARHKVRFGITIAMFTISNTLLAVIPLFIGRLVGALAAHPAQGHEAVLDVWILIICSSGHNLTWRMSELLYRKLLSPLNFEYEGILFRQIIRKPYYYFVDKFTGKIASYVTTISQEQGSLFTDICYNYVSQVVGTVILLGILASVNWQTAAIFLGGICGMILVGRYTVRNSTKYEKVLADVQSTKNAKIIDAIANFVNVKSFRKESREIDSIDQQEDIAKDATKRTQLWGIVFWGSMSVFVRDIMWPAAIGLNVYLFLHGELSIAKLSTTLSTLLLFSTTIWEAIWYFSQFNLRLARIEEAHRYLFGEVNIMHLHEQTKERPVTIPEFTQSLTFTGLNFAYPDKPDAPILRDLSLSLKRGEKLGIVGKSGSGKSTLTKLLLGYYDLPAGNILLDDAAVDVQDIAHTISYVPQDTSLFHRTIEENIAYASSKKATHEDIVEAAKLAHAHEFIEKISDGYDALVGERGVKLSVGQRQRIAIARAFLDDKPILILDEATSALDSESELLIQEALERLWEHKTVIAIAHRLSTLRHMDKIAVMDAGKIIELGSHADLLAAKGTYAKLWAHQSGGFIEE